jgi:outer membrane protein TolC
VQTLPDPRVNLGYKDFTERELRYGARQEFPFPGKLRLRGDVAAREAERSGLEAEVVERRVVAELKSAYYELHLTHRSIEVLERSRQILVDFEKSASTRYGVGRGIQQDVLRAQTEISRILIRRTVLEQQMESQHAEVNRLLNRPPSNALGRPRQVQVTPLRASLQHLNQLVESGSPMVRGQAKGVEKSDRAVALAEREFFPDFEVDVSGLRDRDMRSNGYEVMLSVKVPLYYATRQREGVREALAMRGAAEQELQGARQALLFQVKDNFVRARRAEQMIKLLTEAVIPQATLTLSSAQAGYAVGAVDFLTLLSSLLTLQDNRLELEGEIAEHEKAIARLQGIIGELP